MANTRTILNQLVPDFHKNISGPDSQETMNHFKLPPKAEKTETLSGQHTHPEFKWYADAPCIIDDYIPRPVRVSA